LAEQFARILLGSVFGQESDAVVAFRADGPAFSELVNDDCNGLKYGATRTLDLDCEAIIDLHGVASRVI